MEREERDKFIPVNGKTLYAIIAFREGSYRNCEVVQIIGYHIEAHPVGQGITITPMTIGANGEISALSNGFLETTGDYVAAVTENPDSYINAYDNVVDIRTARNICASHTGEKESTEAETTGKSIAEELAELSAKLFALSLESVTDTIS